MIRVVRETIIERNSEEKRLRREKKEEKEKYGEKRAVRRNKKKKIERKRETRATPHYFIVALFNRCNNGKGKRDGRTGRELRDGRESAVRRVRCAEKGRKAGSRTPASNDTRGRGYRAPQ